MAQKMIELELFEANSFAGISSEHPVVIDFTGRKKNQKVIEFYGDQELGKTSTIMGILYAMGATFNIEKKKLLNRKDKAIDVNLKFTYNGDQYHVIADESRTVLKKMMEDGKWKPEDSPMSMLKQIFGPVGLSPYQVRSMKPKQQIEYFLETFAPEGGIGKKLEKIEQEIDQIFADRRDVNREVTALKNALEIEPLYQNYEKSMQRFAKPLSAEKEKAAFDAITKNHTDYNRYRENLNILKAEHKDTLDKIERLRQELADAEALEKELAGRVSNGDKWMEDHSNVPKDFEKAQKEWLNLSQTLADQEKWKDVLKKEKQFNEKTEEATELTERLETKRAELVKMTAKCLPKVDGLTVKLSAGLDKKDDEGVYYFDKPLHTLSESAETALWCQVFDAAGVNFIFLENTTSFGSKATAIFNELAKNGATIFATRMDREVKEMGISFKTKI